MQLIHLFVTLFKVLVAVSFLGSAIPILNTKPVRAQEASAVNQPLQSEFTSADMAVLEELIEIAQDNSFIVRDARYARGLSRFKDAIDIDIVAGSTSDFAHSTRTSGSSSNDITDTQGLTITIDPVYVISAFQQERSLIARVRETRNQTRVAVIQNYIAYVQARQAASIASRQLNTVVASLPSLVLYRLQAPYFSLSPYLK